MADRIYAVRLTPEDAKVFNRVVKALAKKHGKATFTFVVREAIRSLDRDIREGSVKQ